MDAKTSDVLPELDKTIQARRQSSPDVSYVKQLLDAGEDKILKKVIEEAGEVLRASKDGDKLHLSKEVADVWFHTLVLLNYHGLTSEDVLMELKRRMNISGIDEKKSRKGNAAH